MMFLPSRTMIGLPQLSAWIMIANRGVAGDDDGVDAEYSHESIPPLSFPGSGT